MSVYDKTNFVFTVLESQGRLISMISILMITVFTGVVVGPTVHLKEAWDKGRRSAINFQSECL